MREDRPYPKCWTCRHHVEFNEDEDMAALECACNRRGDNTRIVWFFCEKPKPGIAYPKWCPRAREWQAEELLREVIVEDSGLRIVEEIRKWMEDADASQSA